MTASAGTIYAISSDATVASVSVSSQAVTVTGVVKESKFKQHLPFSKIIIKDNFGATIKDTLTDEEGRFSFKLPCNQQFVIIGSKEYYTPDVKSFKTLEKNNIIY